MLGLSIEVLEADLRSAEDELASATAARIHAHEIENQWNTEVVSLRSLIEVRRLRLHGTVSDRLVESPRPIATEMAVNEELSHIDWMAKQISESLHGLTPPEIISLAESEKRGMHPNYPYTALRTLVNNKRVDKRKGRYYATRANSITSP